MTKPLKRYVPPVPIPDRLREFIMRTGMSQEALAGHLCVVPSSISMYMSGLRKPSRQVLALLSIMESKDPVSFARARMRRTRDENLTQRAKSNARFPDQTKPYYGAERTVCPNCRGNGMLAGTVCHACGGEGSIEVD